MDPSPLPEGSRAFRHGLEALGDLKPAATARLLAATGDVALVLDRAGVIKDLAIGNADLASGDVGGWLDRRWIDTVTVESRPKIEEMLRDAGGRGTPRWRQVNHASEGGEMAMRYLALGAGDDGQVIAIGRDMRAAASLQQRLLQAQQSMERDYIRLRQAESRYRMLFDVSSEAVLIVETATRRIVEANPAALRLAGGGAASLVGTPFISMVDPNDREAVLELMGAVTTAEQRTPARLRMIHEGRECLASATLFRQDRSAFFLFRLAPVETTPEVGGDERRLLAVLDRMPDAFALADEAMAIVAVNTAFLDLTHTARREQLESEKLTRFLGRPGIDLSLLAGQLQEHGVVRNFRTVLRGRHGGEEDVDVSAVAVTLEGGRFYGFGIRSIARRLPDLVAPERDLPRSVEQLTELVGRVSLKEIVRESTDLIERLCIEAALNYTSDNRASAAEILGLSRQSLYAKLHRHKLGNLVAEDE